MSMDLVQFIHERNRIRDLKASGSPWPWTNDPILQRYFISNIDCEDDKTTRWLKANWRDPHEDDPNLWFAISVFRRGLNLPTELRYPVPWMPNWFLKMPYRCNSQAYKLVVGHKKSSGGFHGSQAENLVYYVYNPLWRHREELRPVLNEPHVSYFQRLSAASYMGGWYAYRVICDLKHTKWLQNSPDWWTWFQLGPGTLRGLNRITGRDPDFGLYRGDGGVVFKLSEDEKRKYEQEVNDLRISLRLEHLNAQVVGGALCEFDKYERIRLGEGRVRQYTGKDEHHRRN
jgi:hypothetical protein